MSDLVSTEELCKDLNFTLSPRDLMCLGVYPVDSTEEEPKWYASDRHYLYRRIEARVRDLLGLTTRVVKPVTFSINYKHIRTIQLFTDYPGLTMTECRKKIVELKYSRHQSEIDIPALFSLAQITRELFERGYLKKDARKVYVTELGQATLKAFRKEGTPV